MNDSANVRNWSPRLPIAETITLWPGGNPWAAPTLHSIHSIQLEGKVPDPVARNCMEQEVRFKRAQWQPNRAARTQFDHIPRAALGRPLVAKIWHPSLVVLGDDEGPL